MWPTDRNFVRFCKQPALQPVPQPELSRVISSICERTFCSTSTLRHIHSHQYNTFTILPPYFLASLLPYRFSNEKDALNIPTKVVKPMNAVACLFVLDWEKPTLSSESRFVIQLELILFLDLKIDSPRTSNLVDSRFTQEGVIIDRACVWMLYRWGTWIVERPIAGFRSKQLNLIDEFPSQAVLILPSKIGRDKK